MSDPYTRAIQGFVVQHEASRARTGGYQPWQSSGPYSVPSGFDPAASMMAQGVYSPTRRPSHQSTHASSSSRHTRRSSTFSRGDAQTISTELTVPSRPGSPPLLTCEFVGYNDCNQEFGLNNVNDWINHMAADHLGNRFPTSSKCWFCTRNFEAASLDLSGLWACYRNRMLHIAEHFRSGWTYADMRPDYFFLEHLNENDLIHPARYEAAKEWHEVPQIEGLYPAGSRFPRREHASHEYDRHEPRERYRVRSNGQRVRLPERRSS